MGMISFLNQNKEEAKKVAEIKKQEDVKIEEPKEEVKEEVKAEPVEEPKEETTVRRKRRN